MKKIITVTLLFSHLFCGYTQNLGIGTTNPAYPLTVVMPAGYVAGIVQTNGTVDIGLSTNATSGAWLKTISGHPLNFATYGSSTASMSIDYFDNVGIGTSTPGYKLDVASRMRLQHVVSGNQSAGLWLDGATLPTRSFIGTINDDHVGIWGNGGAGWNFAMNVTTGNIGINTILPTEKLDVNGSVRFRGTGIKKGSILTSINSDGVAIWQQPIAFRAYGSSDGNSTPLPTPNVWSKYYFSTAPDYNIGLAYNANTSEFIAPVEGIYHFTAQAAFEQNNESYGISFDIHFVNQPNDYGYGMAGYKFESNGEAPSGYGFSSFQKVKTANTNQISTDIPLKVGDKVSINLYRNDGADSVDPDIRKTWFSGYLVTVLAF